jgi:hypothetical protein
MSNRAAASTPLQVDDPAHSGAVHLVLNQCTAIDRKVAGQPEESKVL